MDTDYIAEVHRFGGPKPYRDPNKARKNLTHATDFSASSVVTDQQGNVTEMPLLVGKPCFGRPERFYRAIVGSTPWIDEDGIQQPGDTPCKTCFKRSAGVYEACFDVSQDRVNSDLDVKSALDAWMASVGSTLGRRAFVGANGRYWQRFLDAIVSAGGWSNINNDQVRIHLHAKNEADRKARNERRRERRRIERDTRRGKIRPITGEFIDSLNQECDRRAQWLKDARFLPVACGPNMRWLKRMSDKTCDRVADVWRERTIGDRAGIAIKQKDIAASMWADGRAHGASSEAILTSRVSEDIRTRLARLEDERDGEPIWPRWSGLHAD